MELGRRELMTFGVAIATLATTWGVLKATIKTLTDKLEDVKLELMDLNTRMDKVEAKQAVALQSINTMSKDILSPQILREQAERDGKIQQRLTSLEHIQDKILAMHNGKHPKPE